MSRSHGVDDDDLRALASDDRSHFSALEQLVLQYATLMTAAEVEVPSALFEGLRGHFDGPQLVELTAAIAWENYRARFNHALDIQSEGFSEGAFCPIPARAALPPRVDPAGSVHGQ